METQIGDPTGIDLLAALRLQIDWGADEALEDAPVDRLRVPPPRIVASASPGDALYGSRNGFTMVMVPSITCPSAMSSEYSVTQPAARALATITESQ